MFDSFFQAIKGKPTSEPPPPKPPKIEGRLLDYRERSWGHNLEMVRQVDLNHYTGFCFSSVGLQAGDAIRFSELDCLLVYEVEEAPGVYDMFKFKARRAIFMKNDSLRWSQEIIKTDT